MRNRTKVNVLSILLILVGVVTLGLVIFIGVSLYREANPTNDNIIPQIETITFDNQKYAYKENIVTTLVIGLDKEYDELSGTYTNNQQNDFLLLVVYDKDAQETQTLSINRDTMCEVTKLGVNGASYGKSTMQLALAHNYGSGKNDSCRNVRDAVSELLGDIKIDHYVSTTMDVVSIINDAVGGIEIDGELLLGEKALEYVRARKSLETGTNLERMQRQNAYLDILFDKVNDAYALDNSFFNSQLLEINEYLVSDLTIKQMQKLLEGIMVSKRGDIKTISGETLVGKTNGIAHMEFYPNEDELNKHIIDMFYRKVD